ncbi:NADH:ubiquinone oxidoreductase, chain G [Candidatus Nitrotoga sp. HW29]|uniref:NADH-quinone oxidoreductase subunit NuoG n=1 Tax=Candidatus Nitrotoga sp. HW29 TaxID=2886963 RepID=UPI001EF3D0AE|nr:NADH-quinone oxidoreductase subunit NuoG [Candidatus Nitrotoga sp. HW29]CAH1903524.1 NADH:ubiquinone oxidoreductase, chain G [Candidatus Nitrotoga sp. HW29]
MINIEIDGKHIEIESGCSVIDAADRLGIYIPRFCYHKKLSIAANCRMCLVQIEKAPKPLPACATPVAEGMKIFTASEQAVKAQKGVMEFLLINHPLDCPICDQGGECELQDLAVGYGGSTSRYNEEKRVVLHKDIGPLVAAEEMSRCINCTRCVRFGIEIGGAMELGQAFRGEHAEIMAFMSDTVDSELSGNMIDLCPVGALTSKPFRYSARTWELSRRKSISPHDSLGSNLAVQVKNNHVMRVLPIENEAVNECWLSDKDRFSYEGLNSAERLTKPMVKQNGKWLEVEWQVALEYVANGLRQIARETGAEYIGALATPHSTLEELYLLQKLVRGLGSNNVDFRLRQSDFSADSKQAGAPWLGMAVADINNVDRFLLVGSFLRKDHPLLASRVRQATKKGAQVNLIHAADDDLLMPLTNKKIVPPTEMTTVLAQVLKALAIVKQATLDTSVQQVVQSVMPSASAQAMADSLASGERVAILLGNFAQQHPQASQLQLLAQHIAALCGAKFGFFGEAANSVGGYLAQAVPFAGAEHGMNASAMLAAPRKAYILLNVEAELDTQNPQQAISAMNAADMVVALSAYKHHAAEYADVLLPIAPFTETSGTFVSSEGRTQSFKGTVQPLGEARPAWKVLRVLGNMLNISGFDYNNSEAVRDEVLGGADMSAKLGNVLHGMSAQTAIWNVAGLQRVSDVPIYTTDAIVRRAASLQKTRDAATPRALMHSVELKKLNLQSGEMVKLTQGHGSARLSIIADDSLPHGIVRVAAGHAATAELGAMFGDIMVNRA